MIFEIESKYNIGAIIITRDLRKVKIMDIKMRKVDKIVDVKYLVEYEDGTRVWKDEVDFL